MSRIQNRRKLTIFSAKPLESVANPRDQANNDKSGPKRKSDYRAPDLTSMRHWVPPLLCISCIVPLSLSFQGLPGVRADRFTPTRRLPGIGLDRSDIGDDALSA